MGNKYDSRYWNRISFGAGDLVKNNDKCGQSKKPRTKHQTQKQIFR